ncbi:variant erythrocyte surface antigen-1 family protein [Babesia caballi]|uniref:Variant erythrocyte surface antigen-1 family protein n=1 Tax=Babesia caballi TaxID=5871 RepID=A0AAV4LS45_BABCB|nr:variant erythrocyte surface antigen-1 family protein [Babesia caballi]
MAYHTLRDCPSNLKEAIDWILRVSGLDMKSGQRNDQNAVFYLSVQVMKLLLEYEVSNACKGELLEIFREQINNETSDGNQQHETQNAEGGPSNDQRSAGLHRQIINGPPLRPIGRLAEALYKFIGYEKGYPVPIGQYGVGSGAYKSAYDPAKAYWNRDVVDTSAVNGTDYEKDEISKKHGRICANNFMAAVKIIFPNIVALYWVYRKDVGGWYANSDSTRGTDERLNKFLIERGFEDEVPKLFNCSKNLETELKDFKTEFDQLQVGGSCNSHDQFCKELMSAAKENPKKYPFSALYVYSCAYFNSIPNIYPAMAGAVLVVGGGAVYATNIGGIGTAIRNACAYAVACARLYL